MLPHANPVPTIRCPPQFAVGQQTQNLSEDALKTHDK